jgi:helicase
MLEDWEMIIFDDIITVKELGEIVSRLYIDPMTGYIIYNTLNKKDTFSELDTLLLLCRTPDMENLYIKKSDGWIEDSVDEVDPSLVPNPATADYDWFLREMKTSLMVKDWVNEVDEEEICKKYGVYPGDIRRIVENAEWLSHSLSRISEFLNHPEKSLFADFEKRIKFGIKGELVSLIELKGIGRVRARKLYNAGIRTKKDVLDNRIKLSSLIGKRTAEKLISSLEYQI